MAAKPSPEKSVTNKADAQARIEQARAQLKAATERHEAVVSALSRLGASAQDRRLAQAQKKKVDHALREATRLLKEAQAL
jgi:GTPase involved in cell partitioning and DNA repair